MFNFGCTLYVVPDFQAFAFKGRPLNMVSLATPNVQMSLDFEGISGKIQVLVWEMICEIRLKLHIKLFYRTEYTFSFGRPKYSEFFFKGSHSFHSVGNDTILLIRIWVIDGP